MFNYTGCWKQTRKTSGNRYKPCFLFALFLIYGFIKQCQMFVLGIKKGSKKTHIVLWVAPVIHCPDVASGLCFPYSVSYSGCQGTQVLQTSLFLSTIYYIYRYVTRSCKKLYAFLVSIKQYWLIDYGCITWRTWTVLSRWAMYWSFLTRDRWADCLHYIHSSSPSIRVTYMYIYVET